MDTSHLSSYDKDLILGFLLHVMPMEVRMKLVSELPVQYNRLCKSEVCPVPRAWRDVTFAPAEVGSIVLLECLGSGETRRGTITDVTTVPETDTGEASLTILIHGSCAKNEAVVTAQDILDGKYSVRVMLFHHF